MNNITIVGGGTAGWFTALYMKKLYKDSANIILIESKDIGILGAGEGSVPLLYGFLEELELDIAEFIVKTNATHKIGVNFVNWNGENTQYFHSFGPFESKNSYWVDEYDKFIATEYIGYLYNRGTNLNTEFLPNRAALDGSSPFFLDESKKLQAHSRFSYHFDAHLVASYLREIGQSRGIQRVEGTISDFKLDRNNNVNQILLQDSQQIDTDFVFDCSGFHRLLIGKLYNTPWVHYNNQLKVNKAVTFQLPTDAVKIGSYTNAIAMKYGWMWQIPLQNRIGCGYNFDSTYINETQAIQELTDYFGYEPKINQIISYNAGRFQKAWVQNCIAVGLSLGFTEPIEATSIFHIIAQLLSTMPEMLERHHTGSNFIKSQIETQYNDVMARAQDSTLIFLYFHYFTKRTDTPFWKDYLQRTIIPPSLQNLLEKWKTQPMEFDDFIRNIQGFKYHNWMTVADGLEYFDKDIYIKSYENSDIKKDIQNHYLQNTTTYLQYKNKFISDVDFVKKIKENIKK
jgi:tryptophan halogenase